MTPPRLSSVEAHAIAYAIGAHLGLILWAIMLLGAVAFYARLLAEPAPNAVFAREQRVAA